MIKGRVLIVTGDVDTSNALRAHLEAQGYEAPVAANSHDAFKICYRLENSFKMKLPHVILLDATLPDESGYDVCRELRQDQHTRFVPIILLVPRGSSDVPDVGADDYVARPLNAKEIGLRVQRLRPGFYFPPGALHFAVWYFRYLVAMNEPSLSRFPGDVESYRFLWLRTFHPPIAVRAKYSGGEGWLVSKQLDGKGGYEPGKLVANERRPLAAAEWSTLLKHVQRASFWALSPITPELIKVIGLQLDGAFWIIEGLEDGRYHVVDRFSGPGQDEFRACCLYLLQLSGLKVDRIY